MSDNSPHIALPWAFALDIQTTGRSPSFAQILELSLAPIQAKEILPASAEDSSPPPASAQIQTWRVRLPEGQKISAQISQITGLTDEDLTSAITSEELLNHLLELTKQHNQKILFIAHYAVFEKMFLKSLFEIFGRISDYDCISWLCTQRLSQKVWPDLPSHTLRALSGYFDLPFQDYKRATSHVEATQEIWRRLKPNLENQNLTTFDDLAAWLMPDSKKGKKIKAPPKPRSYPLARELRLKLPPAPGVYQMYNGQGQLLYVGKATNLKERVNSYFRGLKGRDRRKLEMMAQVKNIEIEICRSPFEAALRESDLIKSRRPKYNIALREENRRLVFYARDFLSATSDQSETWNIGPFGRSNSLEILRSFHEGWQRGNLAAGFFEVFPETTLTEGFKIFCETYSFNSPSTTSFRSLLAFATNLFRHYAHELARHKSEVADLTVETEIDESFEEPESESFNESENQNSPDQNAIPPEDLSQKYLRLFLRAGQELRKKSELTLLLNSSWESSDHKEPNKKTIYRFVDGILIPAGQTVSNSSSRTGVSNSHPWRNLTVRDYDRMTILESEIRRGLLQKPASATLKDMSFRETSPEGDAAEQLDAF